MSLAVGVSLVTAYGVGCSPEAVVGKSKGTGGCPGCFEDASYSGEGGCAGADASVRTEYDAWRSAPNELGVLPGTVWVGGIDAGPTLTLVFETDQSAYLQVGCPAPPPTDKDAPYLCDAASTCQLQSTLSGGSYPLHGARFGADYPQKTEHLKAVLSPMSPFDAWCHLQVPRLDAQGNCSYLVAPEPQEAGEPCTAAGEPVSCDWLAPLMVLQACECASGGCFARTAWRPYGDWETGKGFLLDLSHDIGRNTLEGTLKSFTEVSSVVSESRVSLELSDLTPAEPFAGPVGPEGSTGDSCPMNPQTRSRP